VRELAKARGRAIETRTLGISTPSLATYRVGGSAGNHVAYSDPRVARPGSEPYGYPHPCAAPTERNYAWRPHRHSLEFVGPYGVLHQSNEERKRNTVHSSFVYSALIDARVEELHRAARPVASPRTAATATSKIHRWTATLATYLKSAIQTTPAERHAH